MKINSIITKVIYGHSTHKVSRNVTAYPFAQADTFFGINEA